MDPIEPYPDLKQSGFAFWQAALLVMATTFGLHFAVQSFSGWFGHGYSKELFAMILSQALVFGAVIVALSKQTTLTQRYIKNTKPIMLLAFLSGLALQLPLALLTFYVQKIWPMDPIQVEHMQALASPSGFWHWSTLIVSVVIIAPIFEEVFFRGFLWQMLRNRYPEHVVWFLTSVLFAMSHMHPSAFIYALIASILLGAVRIYGGGLGMSILLHAGVNIAPLILFYLSQQGVLNVESNLESANWILSGSSLGLLAVFGAIWYVFIKKTEKKSAI